MDACTDVIIELKDSQLYYENEESAGINAYSVAVCGPARFVSKVESSLKKSSLPVKTVAFTKSGREAAESVSDLKPVAVLLDSTFASNGLMRLIHGRGGTIIKMNRETRDTEELRKECEVTEKNRDTVIFVELLCAFTAVCLIWEI